MLPLIQSGSDCASESRPACVQRLGGALCAGDPPPPTRCAGTQRLMVRLAARQCVRSTPSIPAHSLPPVRGAESRAHLRECRLQCSLQSRGARLGRPRLRSRRRRGGGGCGRSEARDFGAAVVGRLHVFGDAGHEVPTLVVRRATFEQVCAGVQRNAAGGTVVGHGTVPYDQPCGRHRGRRPPAACARVSECWAWAGSNAGAATQEQGGSQSGRHTRQHGRGCPTPR